VSRTEDRYREKDAGKKGYWAGRDLEPETKNPYKIGTATHLAWRREWERGRADVPRWQCGPCDQLSLQRITTRSEPGMDIELVNVTKGKKPYVVRCKKCGRQWKTNAEYAQELGSVGGMRRRTCKVCDIPREAQTFGKIGKVECCALCIEESNKSVRGFSDKLVRSRL
jgi:hypothetical protein